MNVARKQMLSETKSSVIVAERFNVTVQPGFSEKTRLVYPRRGHESFAAHPSDLVVELTQKPMDKYERKGDDLVYIHTLTLIEALEM